MKSPVWLLVGGLLAAVSLPQTSKGAAVPAPEAAARLVPFSADHQRLDAIVGQWRFERTTSIPGRPTERATGRSVNRWILGGRYLECVADEGEGGDGDRSIVTYGFDVRRRTYFSLFVGSRGTNYQNLEGFYDEPTHSFVLLGRDAGDGRTPGPKLREVLHLEGPDLFRVEMFIVVPGQPPHKASEITYTRQPTDPPVTTSR
jgi:hypothetical protein